MAEKMEMDLILTGWLNWCAGRCVIGLAMIQNEKDTYGQMNQQFRINLAFQPSATLSSSV